jgi:uncharacterized RDD family membrane protein YckC
MDDYYSLLGVRSDAATDDIRNAYRDKKAALEGQGDKSEIAKVNKAWNVLSDPYQRGRYDEQRINAAADAGIDLTAEEGAEVVEAAAPPRRRRLFEPPDRNAPPPQPTVELPDGKHFAPQRKRLIAMAIDLAVILVLFFGFVNFLMPIVIEDRYPDHIDMIDDLRDQLDILDNAEDELDDAEEELADLQDDEEATEAAVADAQERVDTARTDLERAENGGEPLLERCEAGGWDTDPGGDDEDDPPSMFDRLEECHLDVVKDTQGTQLVVLEGFFVASFLYLVVPSALTGRTLGKKLQGVKVVRVDGSPLGFGGALKRYGLIVLATNALFFILQVFAGVIALMGVLGWMRNPNQQGMHDRAAKTIVIED